MHLLITALWASKHTIAGYDVMIFRRYLCQINRMVMRIEMEPPGKNSTQPAVATLSSRYFIIRHTSTTQGALIGSCEENKPINIPKSKRSEMTEN